MSEELFDKSNDNRIRQNGLIMSTDEVVDLLNSQSKLISEYQYEFVTMRKENERLRQMIKENVLGRYAEGSFADLEFKAIAYDDIIKLETSNESEPKLIVICKRGKKENVQSFCRMFIPHGVYYEIKEVNE